VATDSRTIDTLIGEALKLLAEKEAPAHVLGAFAAEYPQKVRAVLGAAPGLDEPLDLEQAILSAMKRFVEEGHLQPAGIGQERGIERTYVQIGGQRTSISVRKPVMDRLAGHMGSASAARKKVREIASQAPANVPGTRSEWVERQIGAWLALQAKPPNQIAH